jgi:hypothetical protein
MLKKSMTHPDDFPEGYKRVAFVQNLPDLLATPFGGPDEINAIVWRRDSLQGDFNAAARYLSGFTAKKPLLARFVELSARDVPRNKTGPMGDALRQIAQDLEGVRAAFHDVALRVVKPGEYDSKYDLPTVHNYHADVPVYVSMVMGRLLCTYNDPVTEVLRNEDARKAGDKFEMIEGAAPFHFPAGTLWRLAPWGASQLPLIHRAPQANVPRLVLAG